MSAAETEEKLDEVLVEVVAGETIVITHNDTGEPIARFEPCGEPFDLRSLEE